MNHYYINIINTLIMMTFVSTECMISMHLYLWLNIQCEHVYICLTCMHCTRIGQDAYVVDLTCKMCCEKAIYNIVKVRAYLQYIVPYIRNKVS